MFSKSKIRKIVLLLLLFWYSVELAQAGEQIVLSPDGTNSNQNQINEALKKGNVYLGPGVYEITGPIYVQRNTIFSGDSNAKILVSSDISSPWFSPTVGVVNVLDPYNIQITGFEIDGNCQNLNPDWANSPGHAHDQEQLIKIAGSSSNFGNNILIANMKLHNSFGDGIQARFIDGIICSDNTIINTQHECIYFKLCKNCKMLKNQMAVITSGGGRFDNCYNGEAEGNIVWKYDGANNNGAYKGGANGFQVGDAGSSKGYDARTNLIHTENIEIHNNTIIDPGRESIVVDAAGQRPSTNVYIHNNIFVDTEEVKRMGISVSDDISVNNPPSIEMSEKVFSSIFDILEVEFTDTGRTDQKAEDLPLQVVDKEKGIIAGGVKIVGFKDVIVLDNISYIPGEEAVLVQSKAIKSPDIEQFTGTIKKIDKDIDVELKDGKAYATMTVKTTWYTVKKNSITGKNTKSKLKTSTATFRDSCQAPMVLERGDNVKAYINVYSDTKNPIAKLRIPHSNTTQRIEVFYKDNSTTHTFLIGERLTDESGIQYTVFSRCELWDGNIPHMGNEILLIGKFDPAKLKIKYYTPYESFDVEDVEVIYHKTEEENYNMFLLKWIVQIILGLYAGYKIMDIAIN